MGRIIQYFEGRFSVSTSRVSVAARGGLLALAAGRETSFLWEAISWFYVFFTLVLFEEVSHDQLCLLRKSINMLGRTVSKTHQTRPWN